MTKGVCGKAWKAYYEEHTEFCVVCKDCAKKFAETRRVFNDDASDVNRYCDEQIAEAIDRTKKDQDSTFTIDSHFTLGYYELLIEYNRGTTSGRIIHARSGFGIEPVKLINLKL